MAIVCIIFSVSGWWFARSEVERLEQLRESVRSVADGVAADLGRQVHASASAARSLGGIVQAIGGNATIEHFDRVAAKVLDSHDGVNVLQLAPDGVISHIHPLTEKDKGALGFPLLVEKVQRPISVQAIESFPDQLATMVGPFKLVQGGVGAVMRHPVFTSDAAKYIDLEPWEHPVTGEVSEVDCSTDELRTRDCHFPGPKVFGEETHLWGFAQVLSRVDHLTSTAAIRRLTDGTLTVAGLDANFSWQLRETDWHLSLNSTNGIFARSDDAPESEWMEDAVESQLHIGTYALNWTLAVRPASGWPRVSSEFVQQLVLLVLVTVVGAVGMGIISIAALRSADQRRDALQRVEAHMRLEAAQVSAAMQARSRLIRTVMHDLRSPLLAVLSVSTSLLRDPHHTTLGSKRSLLESLASCCTLMEHIISDMLDFERIEAGRFNIVYGPFSLSELTQMANDAFIAVAQAKGISLQVWPIPPHLAHVKFEGDLRRLQQCLNNGISNAFKFSSSGDTVNVRVSAPEHPGENGWWQVRLSVQDEGVGLSASELQVLNSDTVFNQVGLGQMQGNGGTGLGLNICRNILRLHNSSELHVTSPGHGKGVDFTMVLNLEASTATADAVALPEPHGAWTGGDSASAQEETVLPAKVREGYRCLHVEDDAFVRLTLPLQTFELVGAEYEQVEDGRQAVDKVREGRHYDCIIVDNQMPVMSGTACVLELRRLGFRNLVIGVTGDPVGCADRDEFEAAGLNACLDKSTDGMRAMCQLLLADSLREQRALASFMDPSPVLVERFDDAVGRSTSPDSPRVQLGRLSETSGAGGAQAAHRQSSRAAARAGKSRFLPTRWSGGSAPQSTWRQSMPESRPNDDKDNGDLSRRSSKDNARRYWPGGMTQGQAGGKGRPSWFSSSNQSRADKPLNACAAGQVTGYVARISPEDAADSVEDEGGACA